jgi:hypothetical protein
MLTLCLLPTTVPAAWQLSPTLLSSVADPGNCRCHCQLPLFVVLARMRAGVLVEGQM